MSGRVRISSIAWVTASKNSPPGPMRFCSYQRTASANSAEAGWLIRKGSPPENVSLNAALDVLPRFERDGAGLDGIDAPLNLSGPCRIGVRICRTI